MSVVAFLAFLALCVGLTHELTARGYRRRIVRLERRLAELDEAWAERGEVIWSQTKQLEELRRRVRPESPTRSSDGR